MKPGGQGRKGKTFERRVARMLRAAFPGREVRRSLQSHRAYESDVVVDQIPIWWECCDGAAPSPRRKLAQAERDIVKSGRGWYPVVVWHRKHEREVQVTLRLTDLLSLQAAGASSACGVLVTLSLKDFLAEVGEAGKTKAAKQIAPRGYYAV